MDNHDNKPQKSLFLFEPLARRWGVRNNLMLGMNAATTAREFGDAGIGIKVAVYPESGEPEVSEVTAESPRAAGAKFAR